MSVKPIPEGYHTVTPYLAVHGVPQLIKFLEGAFDAELIDSHKGPDGGISNAEVRVGTSMVMMGKKPKDQKAFPAMLYLYVEDADRVYRQAIKAGGKSIMEPTDQFYGDRSGAVEDPSGSQWWIASRKENLTTEELEKRASQFKKK